MDGSRDVERVRERLQGGPLRALAHDDEVWVDSPSDRGVGLEQRREVLDRIEASDRPDDQRVARNAELTTHRGARLARRPGAGVYAVVNDFDPTRRKSFGHHVALQIVGNRVDARRQAANHRVDPLTLPGWPRVRQASVLGEEHAEAAGEATGEHTVHER